MKRSAVVLGIVLSACTSDPEVRYVYLQAPDAFAESAADSSDAQQWPDGQAEAEASPDGEGVPQDAADAQDEADEGATPCPPAMALVGAVCVDEQEVTTEDFDAWKASGPWIFEGQGCQLMDVETWPGDIWPDVSWCGFRAWCASHDKRGCSKSELATACGYSADTTPPAAQSMMSWEWTYNGSDASTFVARWYPCETKPYPAGLSAPGARVRCCKDAQ